MRLILIANPRSGTAPDPERVRALLAQDGAAASWVPIERIADEDSGEVKPGALDALRTGGAPDRVVTAGGDGSIGPAALCAARLGVPLAVVPAGTANDFARAKDLPIGDLEGACALARDPGAATEHAELGLAGERPFVNAAATGLSVAAARAAARHKSRLGALAYAVGAVRAGMTAAPLRCAVRCDGEQRFEGQAWQVVVAVTGAFGGGSEIGVTRPDDGLLDVAIVPAGSRITLVRRAFGMKTGTLVEQGPVGHERGTVIEVDVDGAFNVDGETCRCEPGRFTLHKGGFDLVTAR